MWLEYSLCTAIFFELPITRTPDNSNLFRFPLKVRVIGSRLYVDFKNYSTSAWYIWNWTTVRCNLLIDPNDQGKDLRKDLSPLSVKKPWNWIVYIDLVFTSSYTTQTNSVLHPLWLANSDVHGKPVLEKEQRADVAHLHVIAGNIVNAGPAG